MKKESSVQVQKGEIKPDMKTMKTMTHNERLSERSQELRDQRDGMTLKLHKPKK